MVHNRALFQIRRVSVFGENSVWILGLRSWPKVKHLIDFFSLKGDKFESRCHMQDSHFHLNYRKHPPYFCRSIFWPRELSVQEAEESGTATYNSLIYIELELTTKMMKG